MSAPIYNEEGSQSRESLRVLAVADVVEAQLYNNSIVNWLAPIDLIISCGDLPPNYLDYLMSTLNVPLVHVLGNHCEARHDSKGQCSPESYSGAYNLNGRVIEAEGLLLAGVEGSPLYNNGPHQYTEWQMAWNLRRLTPGLLRNKLQAGRYLDIMVTHAPPRDIHDNEDQAHKGFTSLLAFLKRYKPTFLLHGHTHRYHPLLPLRTMYGETEIINTYGHVLLELERDERNGWRIAQHEEITNE